MLCNAAFMMFLEILLFHPLRHFVNWEDSITEGVVLNFRQLVYLVIDFTTLFVYTSWVCSILK